MANQKQRGKYFEDKVANIIRQILKLRKHQVHRFYESGMATGEYGDIRVHDLPIIIECKYYKNIDIAKLLFNKPKQYSDWIDQLEKDVNVYIQNFEPEYVIPILAFSKPKDKVYSLVVSNTSSRNYYELYPKYYDTLSNKYNSYKVKLRDKEAYLCMFDDAIKCYKEVHK